MDEVLQTRHLAYYPRVSSVHCGVYGLERAVQIVNKRESIVRIKIPSVM